MNRFLFSLIIALGWSSSLWADSAEIVAKARAYLGGDQVLNAVHSLHYIGAVVEETDGKKQPPYPIDMIFQKQYQQRLVLARPSGTDITGLNDYEAWHRLQDPSHTMTGKTALYSKNTVKQLRAGTWENMAFFAGIERVGGSLLDGGLTEVNGAKLYKLSFVHEPTIVYDRFFDPNSGRLILTRIDQGQQEIREEGELIAGGIRFPQRIHNTITDGEGKKREVTITIEKITVNDLFPENLFSAPLLAPPQ